MIQPAARPFTWVARIYYEDTDATGVVYHARYLHFFERARTEWLRKVAGGQQKLKERDGVVFTVANMEIDFVVPARLDDEVAISVLIAQQRRASFHISQDMHRTSDGILLARARVRVGCVDAATFRPSPMPPSIQSNPSPTGVSV